MNLLLVEDEVGIRTRIAEFIPWEEYGIEIVGMAQNGVEALQVVEKKQVDIMLFDIQMPEMDGLTLAERVSSQYPHVRMIILSGYEQFEYAQKAVQLGVMNYLLKPARNAEIVQAVLQAADKIKEERQLRFNSKALEANWSHHLPALRNMFWNNWLTGRYEDWEIKRTSKDLLIELREDALYNVVVMATDPLSDGESRFSRNDESLLQFSLHSIAKEVLEKDACHVVQGSSGETIAVFYQNGAEPAEDFLHRVNYSTTKLLSVVQECLKVTASAGVGRYAERMEELPRSYRQAHEALQERVVYGHHVAIHAREEREPDRGDGLPAGAVKKLELALEANNKELVIEAAEQLLDQVIQPERSIEEVQLHVLLLSSMLVGWLRDKGLPFKEVLGDDLIYFQNTHALTSSRQIKEWAVRSLSAVLAYNEKQRTKGANKLVAAVLAMIEEQLHEDLSLNMIAEKLFVNSSYLSRLFKLETGQSFSQYVLDKKMSRAKELLLNGAKVQEAAGAIGYINVGYFSRMFAKHWGMLPSEVKG